MLKLRREWTDALLAAPTAAAACIHAVARTLGKQIGAQLLL